MYEYINFNGHLCKKTRYEGYYASEYGEIITVKVKGGHGLLNYNMPREHCYKLDKDGYKEVCLSTTDDYGNTIRKYCRVHRLVWETFNGPILNDLTVDHIDRDKTNNNLSNLRLLSREQNASIANINKPSIHKHIYALYQNDVFCGLYDRYELARIFGVNNHMWYKDYQKYFKNIGFNIEFVGSVEDIERVAYY